MDFKVCNKCGAKWMDGQLYWSTGKEGDVHDLAGLVCNDHGDLNCINPVRGSDSGQTWEMRRGFIAGVMHEMERKDKG